MDNALVLASLVELQSAGEIQTFFLRAVGKILGGAFDAAALAIATSEEPKATRVQVARSFDMLIDGTAGAGEDQSGKAKDEAVPDGAHE